MKGTTLARKARELGWTVTTQGGGKRIHISQEQRTHERGVTDFDHVGCGYTVHIHITCDDDGNVLKVIETKTERVHDHDSRDGLAPDAAWFALSCIESGALTIQH